MMSVDQLGAMEGLTLEGLSFAPDSKIPYVLACGSDEYPEGAAEAVLVTLMRRLQQGNL